MLRWSVKGSALLAAEPALPGVGPVRPVDSARFSPTQTTTFTLTAERFGKSAFARQEVRVLDATSPSAIVDTAGALGVDSLQTVAHLDSATWDANARVVDVFGQSGRPLVVRHAGGQAVITSDAQASAALRGTRIGGDWMIHAPLVAGEAIGDPTHPPSDRLRLSVHFTCTP